MARESTQRQQDVRGSMEQWHRATKWAIRSSGNLLWTESRIYSKSFPWCCCDYCRQQIQVENEMECGDVVKRRSLKAMGEELT